MFMMGRFNDDMIDFVTIHDEFGNVLSSPEIRDEFGNIVQERVRLSDLPAPPIPDDADGSQ